MKILPPYGTKAQRATWWLCLLIWSQPIIVGYFITIVNKITRIPANAFYDFLLPAVYIMLIITALPYIRKKLRFSDWLFYIGFLAVFWGSYLIFPNNREYMNTQVFSIPFVMLPLYMLGVCFELAPLKKQFFYISIISIIAQFLFFRVLTTTSLITSYADKTGIDHYMHLSYQVLPYVLYVIWFAIDAPKVVNIGFAILGVFMILILGTRGPFLSVVFFTTVYMVVFKFSHSGLFQKILILTAGALLYVAFTTLISPLLDSISGFGGSTRIIGWLLGIDESSGVSSEARVDIAKICIQELKKTDYMGLGFAGDRTFLDGYFVHNFVLECLVSYGVVMGFLVVIVIFVRLFKGVMRDVNSDICKFLLLLIGLGIIPLLVSGSYIEESWFYLMLGYCSQVLRTPKQQLRT